MIDGRKRFTAVLATLCLTALSGSMLTASPTHAEPSVHALQARVDALYRDAEEASERYNTARESLRHAQTRLTSLRADLDRQQDKVEQIREQVAAAVVSQYQGQALSSTAQVVLSKDPDAFLARITTVSEQNDVQAQMMAGFATQYKKLQLREQAAERELAQIAKTKKQLATEKAEIDKKAGEAASLLRRLEGAQQARTAAAATPSRGLERASISDVPASGRAAAAISYALSQVGDSYVYGSAGPSAFDCSGLTMMAWAQAGVGLPHSSGAQMGSGTPVSPSQLKPGDLVFYYSPVSHVGIYIGNGQIVHAANPSTGVQVTSVYSMPLTGAVSPG